MCEICEQSAAEVNELLDAIVWAIYSLFEEKQGSELTDMQRLSIRNVLTTGWNAAMNYAFPEHNQDDSITDESITPFLKPSSAKH